MSVLCCVPIPFWCRLTKYTVVGTASSPTLAVGKKAVFPGETQHCVQQATDADPLRSGPRTAVVMHLDPLWEL